MPTKPSMYEYTDWGVYAGVAASGETAVARTLFSVALMDDVCPPSTVYAAYNHYAGPKEIIAYSWHIQHWLCPKLKRGRFSPTFIEGPKGRYGNPDPIRLSFRKQFIRKIKAKKYLRI